MQGLQEITRVTLDLLKQGLSGDALRKAITASTGLTGYNLEAPSKKLFPVLSPLRNRIPRTPAAMGATAVNWKAITGINTANIKGGVAFGTRNTEVTTGVASKSATYKTFGLDDSVQDEAIFFSRGFEDVFATARINTLSAVMIEEEKLILGGNTTTALGTPTAPTVTTSTTGGSIAAATYNVAVVALPLYGYLNSTLAALADHSQKSSTTAQVTTGSTSTLSMSTPYVNLAIAYAWFVGTSGNEKLEAITAINSALLTSLAGTGQALSAITTDTSNGANDFDGILPQTEASGSGAYIATLATGTAGTGTALTTDSSGGVVEIDAMLKSLWDNARIGPTLMLVHSQEATNINKKVIAAGGAPIYRVVVDPSGVGNLQAGSRVGSYLNKYVNNVIPIMIHPYLAPGTLIAISETLPYPNNQVPSVFEMDLANEYTSYDWARVQRKYEFGVYATGVLKHYFPAGCGVIRNIANG